MGPEEFADRAAERLESAAARIEADARRLGMAEEKIKNRTGELRLAALLVRDEVRAVSSAEDAPSPASTDNPPLEAQT